LEVDFKKIAEALIGHPVDRLELCRGGRNSRVFQAICGNDTFILKSYPFKTSDPRDRFGTEIKALKYYEANRNPYTPRLLGVDIPRSMALLEWIDGFPVNPPTPSDMDQAIDFIARTHVAEINGGEAFGLATESCLCGAYLERHIDSRLEKFAAVALQEPELKRFLVDELAPVMESARNFAHGATFATPLPQHRRCLIPADFGFHNALKTAGGQMYFIDFEYFGWDDPVRLAADFLLHPGMELDEEKQRRFRRGMIAIFQADEGFEQRLLHLSPLYGIRWALILLNEFLPERWQARVFAGEGASREEVKSLQLEKSRIALGKAVASMPKYPSIGLRIRAGAAHENASRD